MELATWWVTMQKAEVVIEVLGRPRGNPAMLQAWRNGPKSATGMFPERVTGVAVRVTPEDHERLASRMLGLLKGGLQIVDEVVNAQATADPLLDEILP